MVCVNILSFVIKMYLADRGLSVTLTTLIKEISEQNQKNTIMHENIAERHERMVSILTSMADEIFKLKNIKNE
jgi:hypothetical protein